MRLTLIIGSGACLVIFASLLAGLAGCKHGERAVSGEDRIPDDLKIAFGFQGTAGGRMMGYSIGAGGEITRWQGLYPEQNVQASATTDTQEVRRLWQHAQQIGFLEMQEQVMSPAFHFITVSANGDSRRVTWVGRDDDNLTPAQVFYDECVDVAKKALGEEEVDR